MTQTRFPPSPGTEGAGPGGASVALLSWRREADGSVQPGQDSGRRGLRARRHWSEAQRPAQPEPGKRGAGQWRPLGSPSRARGGRGGGREQPERPRPAAWAPASRGRAAPRRPPPAPPAATAAALSANGRWQPACAARRGLAPATRERPRPASPLRGAEESTVPDGSSVLAVGRGESADRKGDLLPAITRLGGEDLVVGSWFQSPGEK
ncbi:uncharacterized protein LOC110597273 isoform X2 [Ictidomys tridecemlineatus]